MGHVYQHQCISMSFIPNLSKVLLLSACLCLFYKINFEKRKLVLGHFSHKIPICGQYA